MSGGRIVGATQSLRRGLLQFSIPNELMEAAWESDESM